MKNKLNIDNAETEEEINQVIIDNFNIDDCISLLHTCEALKGENTELINFTIAELTKIKNKEYIPKPKSYNNIMKILSDYLHNK